VFPPVTRHYFGKLWSSSRRRHNEVKRRVEEVIVVLEIVHQHANVIRRGARLLYVGIRNLTFCFAEVWVDLSIIRYHAPERFRFRGASTGSGTPLQQTMKQSLGVLGL